MTIDAKSAFSILADGSDETTKIAAAFAASLTEEVYFGPGIYGAADLPAFSVAPMVKTAGIAHTIFKNLSTTSRMFEFEKHQSVDLKTSFMDFGGFTLDQNGSTGDGIKVGAMFSRLDNIWVKGQRGAGWAFNIEGPTLGRFGNLHMSNCSNGIRCKSTYYPRFDHLSIERTTGIGLLLDGCAAVDIGSLYLDHGSVAGPAANELLKVVNCSTVNISHLTAEIGTACTLTPNWFFNVVGTNNFNVFGGRINHYSGHGSHYLFYTEGSTFRLHGIEWIDDKMAMILVGGSGNIVARDVVTAGVVSGSRYGVANWEGQATRVEIENWQDLDTPASNEYVSAAAAYIRP